MRVEVTDSFANTISLWVKGSIEQRQPRLSCDIDRIKCSDAVALICSVVTQWNSPLFLLGATVDRSVGWILVDPPELRSSIEAAMKGEVTLSIIDISREGGCTFDLSDNETDDESYSFLAAAWGVHENSVEEIKSMRTDAEVFRGN